MYTVQPSAWVLKSTHPIAFSFLLLRVLGYLVVVLRHPAGKVRGGVHVVPGHLLTQHGVEEPFPKYQGG